MRADSSCHLVEGAPRRRFRLTLEAIESEIPADVRLRAALKTLLRRYRLRCEVVEAVPASRRREQSGRAEPSTMPVENRARISEARTPAAPASVPLGSEVPCGACGNTIVKTRSSRRFCSDFCRDVFHGRRTAGGSA